MVVVAPGQSHFVLRLCEKVTAPEDSPQAGAVGCLQGGMMGVTCFGSNRKWQVNGSVSVKMGFEKPNRNKR